LVTNSNNEETINTSEVLRLLMLFLSFQKPLKQVTHLTSATLDKTSSTDKLTSAMLATRSHQSNPNFLQIDISYQLESLDSFSWADFPILQHCLIPIPHPPAPRPMEMKKVPAKLPEKCPKKLIRKKGSSAVMFTSVHGREHAVTVGDHDLCEGQESHWIGSILNPNPLILTTLSGDGNVSAECPEVIFPGSITGKENISCGTWLA
jgi:hypothetical protein